MVNRVSALKYRVRKLAALHLGHRAHWNGFDCLLVGYPKTGNTWMQTMLRKAMLLHYGLGDDWFGRVLDRRDRIPDGVPAVCVTHFMPRFTHENYRQMRLHMDAVAGQRVILLLREPKDTLVSLYMHRKHRLGKDPRSIARMVRCPVFGIDKYIAYYRAWHQHRDRFERLLLLRYEEMRADPAGALRHALDVVGIPRVEDSLVEQVVEFGSAENMRKLEQSNAPEASVFGRPVKTASPEARHVRKARIGGYKDYMDAGTIAFVDQRIREGLPEWYGYGDRGETPHQPIPDESSCQRAELATAMT